MAESSVPGAVGEPRSWIDIELDAIRERSRTDDQNLVLAQGDRNTLLEHVTNLTIKLRAGGAVGEREEPLMTEWWTPFYDDYDRQTYFVAPKDDVDRIIADGLTEQQAEAICDAHNAHLSVNEGGVAPVEPQEPRP